jgi:hypothetical protein
MQAEIKGTTMPVLEVTLQQGEQVISTHGELSWMTPNIQLSQHMGTGGQGGGGGGFMQGLKRAMGGGGLFLTHYEAMQGAGMVTFAAKLPGHIVPTDIAPGQSYFVHHHGWLCGTPGITPSIGLQQTFRGGMWGGDADRSGPALAAVDAAAVAGPRPRALHRTADRSASGGGGRCRWHYRQHLARTVTGLSLFFLPNGPW